MGGGKSKLEQHCATEVSQSHNVISNLLVAILKIKGEVNFNIL